MEYLKDQALKKLNYYYYGCMFLAIVLVSVMFYVSRGENPILPHLDRASSLGYALQTVVILMPGFPLTSSTPLSLMMSSSLI